MKESKWIRHSHRSWLCVCKNATQERLDWVKETHWKVVESLEDYEETRVVVRMEMERQIQVHVIQKLTGFGNLLAMESRGLVNDSS